MAALGACIHGPKMSLKVWRKKVHTFLTFEFMELVGYRLRQPNLFREGHRGHELALTKNLITVSSAPFPPTKTIFV